MQLQDHWFLKLFQKQLKRDKSQGLLLFQEIIMMCLELIVPIDRLLQWEMEVWYVQIWRFKISWGRLLEELLGWLCIMVAGLDGERSSMEDMGWFWQERRGKGSIWETSCFGTSPTGWVEGAGLAVKMLSFMLSTWWSNSQGWRWQCLQRLWMSCWARWFRNDSLWLNIEWYDRW